MQIKIRAVYGILLDRCVYALSPWREHRFWGPVSAIALCSKLYSGPCKQISLGKVEAAKRDRIVTQCEEGSGRILGQPPLLPASLCVFTLT